MAGPRSRPSEAIHNWRGIRYRVDLARCNQALVELQIVGEIATLEDLANAVGVSRSTVSRFLAGRPTALNTTLRILRTLRLEFKVVVTPLNLRDPNGRDQPRLTPDLKQHPEVIDASPNSSLSRDPVLEAEPTRIL